MVIYTKKNMRTNIRDTRGMRIKSNTISNDNLRDLCLSIAKSLNMEIDKFEGEDVLNVTLKNNGINFVTYSYEKDQRDKLIPTTIVCNHGHRAFVAELHKLNIGVYHSGFALICSCDLNKKQILN